MGSASASAAEQNKADPNALAQADDKQGRLAFCTNKRSKRRQGADIQYITVPSFHKNTPQSVQENDLA